MIITVQTSLIQTTEYNIKKSEQYYLHKKAKQFTKIQLAMSHYIHELHMDKNSL